MSFSLGGGSLLISLSGGLPLISTVGGLTRPLLNLITTRMVELSKDNTTRLVVYLSICKHDSLGRVSLDNTTEMVDFLLISKPESLSRVSFDIPYRKSHVSFDNRFH